MLMMHNRHEIYGKCHWKIYAFTWLSSYERTICLSFNTSSLPCWSWTMLRASIWDHSVIRELNQTKSKFVVFFAAFCIEMYYPSLKVSVGSLSPLASRLDSVALFGENCNLLLVVPENCWCCCNVDEKSCRLLNYPSFVQSALFDAKPREDEVLVVFDDDWSSTERGRKAERQSIWLRAVSGHMDYLSLTPDSWLIYQILVHQRHFFFFPRWEHGIWAQDEITKDRDTWGKIPKPCSQNISYNTHICPHIV